MCPVAGDLEVECLLIGNPPHLGRLVVAGLRHAVDDPRFEESRDHAASSPLGYVIRKSG